MNQSELLLFLDHLGQRPNKRLSQNFLIDQNMAAKIVRTADLHSEDSVLEIGPGAGALTSLLLKTGAKVFAVEKDLGLAKALSRLQTQDNRLSIFCMDFLDFDFAALLPHVPLKVIANLPYHITTPILEKLLNAHSLFSSFTIMVQNEMASRILASSGSKECSSLSIFLPFYSQPTASFKVPASCFYPRPKVDSKVLRLDLREPPLKSEVSAFFTTVRRAFQQRRKKISSSLSALYSPSELEDAFSKAKIPSNARPEDLSLEQWVSLFSHLKKLS